VSSPSSLACASRRCSHLPPYPAQAAEHGGGALPSSVVEPSSATVSAPSRVTAAPSRHSSWCRPPPSDTAFLRFLCMCCSRGSLTTVTPPVTVAAIYSKQCISEDPPLSSTAPVPLPPLLRPFFLRAGPEPSPLPFSRCVTVELDYAKAPLLLRCLSPARAPVRTHSRSIRSKSLLPLPVSHRAATKAKLCHRVACVRAPHCLHAPA
jgi:hypothetical protein